MKIRDIEKKIYELLGVNIFRKYFLFTYEKLWKPFGGTPGYRIKNKTINDIEGYKSQAKGFAIAHFIFLICVVGIYYFFHVLTELQLITQLILNPYCIMTQRYNCIRINEILEKHKALEKRKEEKQRLLDHQQELNENADNSEDMLINVSKKNVEQINQKQSEEKEPFDINNYSYTNFKQKNGNLDEIPTMNFNEEENIQKNVPQEEQNLSLKIILQPSKHN